MIFMSSLGDTVHLQKCNAVDVIITHPKRLYVKNALLFCVLVYNNNNNKEYGRTNTCEFEML